ncbi:MAG: glycoside hydrolase family 31 protein, partial [Eubacteriales bacterium]|nr:glycoside hydrolase family 31 protein [Eubacteriales bacterium]
TKVSLGWKVNGIEMPLVQGKRTAQNDQGQSYYSFSIQTPPQCSEIEYSFLTDNDNVIDSSPCFNFETVRIIELDKPFSVTENDTGDGVCVLYKTDTKKYALNIHIKSNISIFFESYLSDKIAESCQFVKNYALEENRELTESCKCANDRKSEENRELTENCEFSEKSYDLPNGYTVQIKIPFRLVIQKDGIEVVNYEPKIRLWIDRKNDAYKIETGLMMRANAFYGFGEKFDGVNQKGKAPLSYVVEQYSDQQDKTYFPIPFFFTDYQIGYLQHGTWKTQFFLNEEIDGKSHVRVCSRCTKQGRLFDAEIFMGTPSEIIHAYAKKTGSPALPPKWAFGPWMSSNGWNTQTEALEQVEQMNRLAIPSTVMVLEAWSDEETFYIWNDAKYIPKADGGAFLYQDFTFSPEGKWPNPKKFIDTLHANNLELILWQIPAVKYDAAPHGKQLELDTEYAIENGLCILNEDGSPYRITEMWFGNSLMPDFSNEKTCNWWFDKRKYLITELGIAGFKTDGGEFLFDERSYLSDGRRIEEAHNDYPILYEKAYHQFLNQTKGAGKGITFSRAGYTGAQQYPIHWAGDQISKFSELKAQLLAGLSLGLSGVPFWGFDIGGFAGDFPSTELYLRSTALAAFAPIMQFHSEPRYGQYYMTQRNHWNNDRSPWNMAIANQDERIIDTYRLYANLRMNMLPYLWKEAQFCAETSRPMMAHLIYDYPSNREILDIEDEYMLGRDILVAPIITEGAVGREVWLPPGNWYGFWDGQLYDGNARMPLSCNYNRIPVFVRKGSILPFNINHALLIGSESAEAAISNCCNRYERLCFFSYGGGISDFKDDMGADFRINISGGQCSISGKLPSDLTVVPIDGDEIGEYIVNNCRVHKALIKQCKLQVFGAQRTGYQILSAEK